MRRIAIIKIGKINKGRATLRNLFFKASFIKYMPINAVIKNPFFNLKIHLWWRKNQDKSPFLPLGWRFFSNVARPKWRVKSEGNDGFEKVFGVKL
jgi:hypothetical protein